MKYLLAVMLLALGGCATGPQVSAVVSDSFDHVVELTSPEESLIVELPASLPSAMPAYTTSGERVSGFTPAGMKQLLHLKHAAEANTQMLYLAVQVQQMQITERNLLLKAAKLEQQRANFYAEKWAVTQNELQAERSRYTVMDTAYKVLIGLGLLVLIP